MFRHHPDPLHSLLKRAWIILICLATFLFSKFNLKAQEEEIHRHVSVVLQQIVASSAIAAQTPGEAAPHEHPAGTAPHVHPQTMEEAMPDMPGMAGHSLPAADAEQVTSPNHVHTAKEAKPHEHSVPGTHAHEAGTTAHEDSATPDTMVVRGVLLTTLIFAGTLLFFTRRSLITASANNHPQSGAHNSGGNLFPGKGASEKQTARMNVLGWPVIGKLLRWRHFNALVIAPTLAVFLFIIGTGLFAQQDTSNPAILLTWILWWPAVIFSFLLLGRIWCMTCPFGYMGDVAQKIFSLKKKVPLIFRNMWWRLGLFLALTWATTMWGLDRWPWGTAWLALSITLGAILFGVLYEKRAFCRYICPVGGVFGLYSMTAPVRIGVKDKQICQEKCATKNCYKACAWWEFAPTIERNLECNLCLDCARACPYDNVILRAQPVGTDLAEFRPHRRSLDEGATVAAVLGVSLLQTAVMLNAWKSWEAQIGGMLNLAPGPILYTFIFLTLGLVIPTILFAIVTYLGSPAEERRQDALRAFRTYAYAFLPLGLALHAAHNFHHLFGEGEAMVLGVRKALADYTGWATLAPANVADAAAALGPNAMFLLQGVALLGGLYLAFRVGTVAASRYGASSRAFRMALPVFLFAIAYTILNILILSAPMAHRH